jgi:ribosomal protein S18 acetylase RimI-like enzyme
MTDNLLKIVSGEEAGIERLCEGFNRGFGDYKYGTQFDEAGMERFLARSGVELRDSAVLLALEQGEWRGTGVALLAVEGDEAWCGGLAVAPVYRGRRNGEALMVAIQQQARMRGVRTLWLEVLVENQAARRLYERLGYEVVRELLFWERPTYQGALPVPYERLQESDPVTILEQMHGWHDQPPSWQRREGYLRRSSALMQGFTIPARDGLPVAYALCYHGPDWRSGEEVLHIFDAAVDPTADTVQAGRPLFQALQLKHMEARLTLVNEPAESKLNRIFAALGFYVTDRQYEMVLRR